MYLYAYVYLRAHILCIYNSVVDIALYVVCAIIQPCLAIKGLPIIFVGSLSALCCYSCDYSATICTSVCHVIGSKLFRLLRPACFSIVGAAVIWGWYCSSVVVVCTVASIVLSGWYCGLFINMTGTNTITTVSTCKCLCSCGCGLLYLVLTLIYGCSGLVLSDASGILLQAVELRFELSSLNGHILMNGGIV